MKLFYKKDQSLDEVSADPFKLERDIQNLIEENISSIFGYPCTFLMLWYEFILTVVHSNKNPEDETARKCGRSRIWASKRCRSFTNCSHDWNQNDAYQNDWENGLPSESKSIKGQLPNDFTYDDTYN